ncbi:MAG: acetylxylan esterase [Planctomycetales bacterium]|nr:acetylxylan esterase [Planctomycetales bacterium]
MRNILVTYGALGLLMAHVTYGQDTATIEQTKAIPAMILPADYPSGDQRLGELTDLNGYFPFAPPADRRTWESRRSEVQRRILVANGLWPMPARGPVNATVHSRIDREDYSVECVYLESYPGFYVTGSLYRPRHGNGPFPAVLSPHGHFSDGRFFQRTDDDLKQQLERGAEQFEIGGRYPLQARCVQLARMGCIVFHYDMIGYADSQQLSYDLAHRHSNPRPEMESPDAWGFFSPQAELRLQSIMGLQTFNSIRALDWLASLPEVDMNRIGVTGASGGGTQTMILAAIDDRVDVSFPAVMVSTAMQGGCTCENACCLRVGTGNVEFAGVFAPKPMGMTAADDWTKEIATKGYPELQTLYSLYKARDSVLAVPLIQFPHNYNSVSRHAMYAWMKQHLSLDADEHERDFEPLTREELTVWKNGHPSPPNGPDYERQLTKQLDEASLAQLARLQPTDLDTYATFQRTVGGAWQTLLAYDRPSTGPVTRTKLDKIDHGNFWEFHDLLSDAMTGSELPTLFLLPKQNWNGEVTVVVTGSGKRHLTDLRGHLIPSIRARLEEGYAIVGVDLLYQGELAGKSADAAQNRQVDNPRDFAGYTYGYNPTLFAHRVHDVLSLIAFIRQYETPPSKLHVWGLDGAGPIVAAARALAGDAIDEAVVHTAGFRFADLTQWRDANFVPGAVKYGDVPALLALSAPHRLTIVDESAESLQLVRQAYDAAGATNQLKIESAAP